MSPTGFVATTFILSKITGTKSENVVADADTPTHTGVIALARSAFAKNPSASLAQPIVAAATSLPSATATRPTYSAPIPIAAETNNSEKKQDFKLD